MSNIDDAIRQALSAEDSRALDAFAAEQTVLQQVFAKLGGQYRWLNIIAVVGGTLMLALGAYCLWRFLNTTAPRDMTLWAGGLVFAWSSLAMLKLWFWMGMHHNQVIREVKRLELQVARLAARGQI